MKYKHNGQWIEIPKTDLSNYYNKGEVDELIPTIPREIYVGKTAPTDPNAVLWVDPDEDIAP